MWKRITYPFLIFLMGGVSAFALDPPSLPPRTPVIVGPKIPIDFGTFTAPNGGSGSITMSADGLITETVNVYSLSGITKAAQFEFELMPGRTVYIRFPSVVNLVSVDGKTMQFTQPVFKLEGGVVEQMPNYIRFKSHVGSNRVHRLMMGGKLVLNSSSMGTYNSSTNNMGITIEAH